MAVEINSGEGDHRTPWERFSTRWAGHAALTATTIYALPGNLIDAIQAEIPGFFSPDEVQFERDLDRTAGSGFFLGQSFSYLGLAESPPSESLDSVAIKVRKSAKSIAAMLADDLRNRGLTEAQIEAHHARHAGIEQSLLEMQRSYAAWLVTSPQFDAERRSICEARREEIIARGSFPTQPWMVFSETIGVRPDDDPDLYEDCTLFYHRWALDGMATFDLPIPMRAQMTSPSLYPLDQVEQSGLLTFLPWWAMRDKSISVRDLYELGHSSLAPEHLQPWTDGEGDAWGPQRYRDMLALYLYLELALRRRYPDKLRGRVTKLDIAFGMYLYGHPERATQQAQSVEKIRKQMASRLKKCQVAPPN